MLGTRKAVFECVAELDFLLASLPRLETMVLGRVASQRRRNYNQAAESYHDDEEGYFDDEVGGTHRDWDDGEVDDRAPRSARRVSDEFGDAQSMYDDVDEEPYDDEMDDAILDDRHHHGHDPHRRHHHHHHHNRHAPQEESTTEPYEDDDRSYVDDFEDGTEYYDEPEDGRSSRRYGDAEDRYEDESDYDPNYHAAHGYHGRDGRSFHPTDTDHATRRGHGVYVEHPHTGMEDVAHGAFPEPKAASFDPHEPGVETESAGDFPAFFHHKVGDYGDFGLLSRIYLEIRQMMMFGLTTLGLTIVINLAFVRYMNPFRKHYPKARVDFEFDRRITGERYSERVEYYAEYWGYKCEEYEVTTKGGWILKVHRVSDPRRPGGRGYPVLLQHGILCTSLFFFTSEERSLGFWLVDQGYDVWSSNIRSNYGAGHTRYKRWDPRFWAWGLVELGDDLVDVVNFVLEVTGYKQLAYVGHSQGTGSMFLALNKFPTFGHKLSSFTALGPAVYPGASLNRLPFKVMKMTPSRWAWSLVFGVREFMPALGLARAVLPKFLMGHLGYIIFAYLFDFHDHNWVDRHKPKVFCSTGVLTSSELLYYWIHSFIFRGCVFDPRLTQPWFNKAFPPLTVAYGSIDQLVVGKPLIERLLTYESNVQIVHILELQGYEHMDMVLGVDAYKTVFPKIKDTIVRTIDPEDAPMQKSVM